MTVKGRKMRVIEIRAEGEEDALRTASEADDPDRFASEIKNNLLLQHSYNKGFTPDIRIIPTAEDIASGRDAVLEKGLEIIKKNA